MPQYRPRQINDCNTSEPALVLLSTVRTGRFGAFLLWWRSWIPVKCLNKRSPRGTSVRKWVDNRSRQPWNANYDLNLAATLFRLENLPRLFRIWLRQRKTNHTKGLPQ